MKRVLCGLLMALASHTVVAEEIVTPAEPFTGWSWYNEPKKPPEQSRKPQQPAPQAIPDLSKMSPMEQARVLKGYTQEALNRAILYPSRENTATFLRWQKFWTDRASMFSQSFAAAQLSQLASSGFQESARQSQVQAQTALDGYNHSVTSGWSQLSQLSHQTGTSDSLTSGSENSQATNATRGASMMMSAAESYAKANNISTQEAYNKLMDISNQGSVSAGIKGTAGGGLNLGVVKLGAEGSISGDLRHSTGSSRGIQNSDSHSQDMRHDQNSQAVNDFRQGMDMVKSSRITDGANHSENAASSNVQQLAATLNDAESQYHQYTTSSTQSSEFSRMATVAQNQSASLDTNYTQEFVDWAANKYGDKAQSMLTSAPSAREAAMEFVNERLKPEIMGDYQQGRSDLTSGQEHAAFSGEHVVQPANSIQQGSGPAGNDGGVRYSPVESGSYNSNGTGNHHTDGASQVTEYAGTYGGQVSSGGGSVSVRTGGSASGSHESSLLAQNQTDSENLAGQREISHNEVRSDYGRQEQSSQIQSGTHRSEQDSLSIKSSVHDTGRHSTERQRSDSSAGMQQELRQSGTLREQGGATGHRNEMSHSPATMNVEEQRVQGNAMQASFKENQAKLHEQSGQGFGPQNDIQRRVAEQRSENEHKINESAGEIDKKQSTVQASSDILKGENLIGQGRFKLGRAEAELDQSSKLNPFNDLQPDELQQRVAELRKKTGG